MDGALQQTLEAVVEESKAIRDVAIIAEQARKRLLKVTLVVAALGVALLIGLIFVASRLLNLTETITSCTTPDGECYRQSQSRTGQVVQHILDGQIANAECVIEQAPDQRACVEQKLEP